MKSRTLVLVAATATIALSLAVKVPCALRGREATRAAAALEASLVAQLPAGSTRAQVQRWLRANSYPFVAARRSGAVSDGRWSSPDRTFDGSEDFPDIWAETSLYAGDVLTDPIVLRMEFSFTGSERDPAATLDGVTVQVAQWPFVLGLRRRPELLRDLVKLVSISPLALLVVPLTRTMRRRRRQEAGRCPACGYDVRNTATCSECGLDVPAPARASVRPAPWS